MNRHLVDASSSDSSRAHAGVPAPAAVGAAIRTLRRQQHLTQIELGRRIGMRPGPMNNIEQGRSLPSTPVLCRIAAVLGVTVDSLLHPEKRPAYVRENQAAYCTGEPEETAGYRTATPRPNFSAPAAHPVHLLAVSPPYPAQTLRQLEDVVHAFLALEDICGVPKRAAIPLCLAMPRTEVGIEDLAMRVRGLLGIGPAVIFDYLELFENTGLRVIFGPLAGGIESAACHDAASGNAFLFVSTSGRPSTERQLFRLVLELGRIYCHTGGVRTIEGRTRLLDAEHVAAKFTAFFLMPAESVHATVRQVGVPYDGWTWELLLRLKHRFGVSAETFLYRLGELDLIAPRPLADLKARIHAHYAATRHAEPDGSRRILSPNGRLGDLLLMATSRATDDYVRREVAHVRKTLARCGARRGGATEPTPHPILKPANRDQ